HEGAVVDGEESNGRRCLHTQTREPRPHPDCESDHQGEQHDRHGARQRWLTRNGARFGCGPVQTHAPASAIGLVHSGRAPRTWLPSPSGPSASKVTGPSLSRTFFPAASSGMLNDGTVGSEG